MNEHPPDENDLRSIAGSDVIGTGRLESFNDSLRSWRSGYRRC
jgi:hypothetical protein